MDTAETTEDAASRAAVIRALPASTSRLISCGQSVTSAWSAVKELLENAVDAGASRVSILLEDFGLARIEVRDDGCGIEYDDVPLVANADVRATSKISDFSDLSSARLRSFGFRGEAVAALCAVADVTITTRTKNDQIGHRFVFDPLGKVESVSKTTTTIGTTVTASSLFSRMPVRRAIYDKSSRKRDELNRIETVCASIALARPNVRIEVKNSGAATFSKQSCADIRQAALEVLGFPTFSRMEAIDCAEELSNVGDTTVQMFVPKLENANDDVVSRANGDRLFILVNGRPVEDRGITKVVKRSFCSYAKCDRYPVAIVSIRVAPEDVDINLEPNKLKVMLSKEKDVQSAIEARLQRYFESRLASGTTSRSTIETAGADSGLDSSLALSPSLLDKTPWDMNLKEIDLGEDQADRWNAHFAGDSSPPHKGRKRMKLNNAFPTETSNDKDFPGTAFNYCASPSSPVQLAAMPVAINFGLVAETEARMATLAPSAIRANPASNDPLSRLTKSLLKAGEPNSRAHIENRPPPTTEASVSHYDVVEVHDTSIPREQRHDFSLGQRRSAGKDPVAPIFRRSASFNTPTQTQKRRSRDVFGDLDAALREANFAKRSSALNAESGSSQRGNRSLSESVQDSSLLQKSRVRNQSTLLDSWSRGTAVREKDGSIVTPVQIAGAAQPAASRLSSQKAGCLPRSASASASMPQPLEAFLRKMEDKKRVERLNKLRAERRHIAVTFDVNCLGSSNSSGEKSSEPSYEVIGALADGFVCRAGAELVVFNAHRAEETLIFERLLTRHSVASRVLDEPIDVTAHPDWNEKLEDVLRQMERSSRTGDIIDERLDKNGFKARLTDVDGKFRVVLTSAGLGVSADSAVSDFLEILWFLRSDFDISLAKSRPVSIRNYLASEAARMEKQKPPGVDRKAVAGLLSDMFKRKLNVCLHERPIFSIIHNF